MPSLTLPQAITPNTLSTLVALLTHCDHQEEMEKAARMAAKGSAEDLLLVIEALQQYPDSSNPQPLILSSEAQCHFSRAISSWAAAIESRDEYAKGTRDWEQGELYCTDCLHRLQRAVQFATQGASAAKIRSILCAVSS